MKDRFKFRAVLKTDKFTILVETFYILNSCYFIDINKAEVKFKCKYPDECFWDFIEEIEKQDYIQEISIDGDLIITKDFTNLVQCTGLKDKFGKLIYEGDIVKEKWFSEDSEQYEECLYVVEFSQEHCAYCLTEVSNGYKNFFVDLEYIPEDYEIIGNIYENPDLLVAWDVNFWT